MKWLALAEPASFPLATTRISAHGPLAASVEVSGRMRGLALICALWPPRGPGQVIFSGTAGPCT
ncbi:hypothetical protein D3C72_2390240 [compost metagenome]